VANPTDTILTKLKQEIDKVFPDWLGDLMLHGTEPEYTNEIGAKLAKSRASFKKLDTIKQLIKDAREDIIRDMQKDCEHPFVVHTPRSDDSSEVYTCEVCGLTQYEPNNNIPSFAASRFKQLDDPYEYIKYRNLENKIKF